MRYSSAKEVYIFNQGWSVFSHACNSNILTRVLSGKKLYISLVYGKEGKAATGIFLELYNIQT